MFLKIFSVAITSVTLVTIFPAGKDFARCFGVAQAETIVSQPSFRKSSAPEHKKKPGNIPIPISVTELSDWIFSKTNWALRKPLPKVQFVSKSKLCRMYYKKECGPKTYAIAALYRTSDQVIFLRKNWSPKNLRDRGALLHELVHHFQAINKVKFACRQLKDEQAYRLHIEWLKKNGVDDPLKLLGINDLTLHLMTKCPDPISELIQWY